MSIFSSRVIGHFIIGYFVARIKEMAKMRILVFSTAYLPFVGGAEVAIKEITDRLSDFTFELITARLDKKLAREEMVGNVLVHRVGIGSRIDKLLVPFLGAFKIFKLGKFDVFWPIMVTYASGAAYIYNILKFWNPTPVILNLQEGDSEEHLVKRHYGLIDLSWRWALALSSNVSVLSNYLGQRARRLGYEKDTILIPNGVSSSFLDFKWKRGERKAFREALGYTDEDYVVITTSRLVTKNAVDDIIRAFAYLPKRFKFLSIGDGTDRHKLENMVSEYSLRERVKLLPFVDNVLLVRYLAMADVFVRPSRSEGLGVSFLEAMAIGLPIIGTNVGGIPDFLGDGITGFVCETNNPHSIAEKIQLSIVNKPLTSSVIKKAKTLVNEKYVWSGIAESYANLFRRERHRLLVVTPIYPPEIGGPATHSVFLEQEFKRLAVCVRRISLSSFRHLPAVFSHLVFAFKILINAFHVDTIYVLDPVGVGLPGAIIASMLGRRLVLRVAGSRAWETASLRGYGGNLDDFISEDISKFPLKVRIWSKIERRVALKAERVIVPGGYLVKIMKLWGVKENKIFPIPNPVQTSIKLSRTKEKKELGLLGKVILSGGRLVPWKGFGELLDVFALIRDERRDVKLYIAGDGPLRDELTDRTRKLDIGDSVVFLGVLSQNELYKYLSAADLFVLNTSYEGFSHQVLEAMALGTPVVTTNILANRALITNRANGLLYDLGNVEILKTHILNLFEDDALAKSLSKKAREDAMLYDKGKISQELFTTIYPPE
ncbi:MAG TPA: glycosyltransferase [Candidatus Paceibacterota bacterium]